MLLVKYMHEGCAQEVNKAGYAPASVVCVEAVFTQVQSHIARFLQSPWLASLFCHIPWMHSSFKTLPAPFPLLYSDKGLVQGYPTRPQTRSLRVVRRMPYSIAALFIPTPDITASIAFSIWTLLHCFRRFTGDFQIKTGGADFDLFFPSSLLLRWGQDSITHMGKLKYFTTHHSYTSV